MHPIKSGQNSMKLEKGIFLKCRPGSLRQKKKLTKETKHFNFFFSLPFRTFASNGTLSMFFHSLLARATTRLAPKRRIIVIDFLATKHSQQFIFKQVQSRHNNKTSHSQVENGLKREKEASLPCLLS